jgi:hypothetical protein
MSGGTGEDREESQNIWYPGRDLNQSSPEYTYMSEALPLEST